MNETSGAFLFDLYGTLLRPRRGQVYKHVPRALGIGGKAWVLAVRQRLLVESFSTSEALVEAVCQHAGVEATRAARSRAAELLQQEVASVEPIDGAIPVLQFLRRRGSRLGVVSNLSSLHTEPYFRHGLNQIVEHAVFSCEVGKVKPEPGIYHAACEALGAAVAEVTMVGDSLLHDVRKPRALGMRAFQVGTERIPTVAHLAWVDLDSASGDSLVSIPESDLPVTAGPVAVLHIEPLSDSEQGRYNLVARLPHGIYAKRFLLPEAAHVEICARRLMSVVGLDCGAAALSTVGETILLTEAVPGDKLTEKVADPRLAEQIGRHCVTAYLLGNADIRPRNTFVEQTPEGPVMRLIDLEHMFFNLALDLTGLEHPERPETFDSMSAAEFHRRLKRQVLTPRTTRRVVRAFHGSHRHDREVARGFCAGWHAGFAAARRHESQLLGALTKRIREEPPLVIGTHAYRRAMASLDIRDIESRIRKDPSETFDEVAGLRI